MNEYEKIDSVLVYIIKDKSVEILRENISHDLKISHQSKEFVEIINKLVKDGYIGVTESKKSYYSTFEGRLFVKNGGYLSQRTAIAWQKRYIILRAVMDITNIIAIIWLTILIYLKM